MLSLKNIKRQDRNLSARESRTNRCQSARLILAAALLAVLMFGAAPQARADTVTYYFTAYDGADPGNWDSAPDSVVDGSTSTSGNDNDDNDYLDLTENESIGTDLGSITAVEVRGYFENNYDVNPVRTVCP